AYKDSTYTGSAKTDNAVEWGEVNTVLATFDSAALRTVTLNGGDRAANTVTMEPTGVDNHVLNGTLSTIGHEHGQAWEPGTLALFSAAVDESEYAWLADADALRDGRDLPSSLAASLVDWWTFGGPATVHGGVKRTGLLVPVGGTPTRGGP